MRKRAFLTGILTFVLAFGLILAGCAFFGEEENDDDGGTTEESDDNGNTVINQTAIGGVTAPVTGAVPVTTVTETLQYTGAITWLPPVITIFAANQVYSASITLTAKPGYTFNGVEANAFTVAGSTTATNPAGAGTVTAVFPGTAASFTAKTDDSTLNTMVTLGLVGTSATSNAPGVATPEITGGRIKITSVSAGTATISVKDAANHEATISITVAGDGAITIGSINKFVENSPLIGAWKIGTGTDIDELLIFTSNIGYVAYSVTKQDNRVDTANTTLRLAITGVNNGNAKPYSYEIVANKLVIKDSYFTDNQSNSIDFAFTRIESSTRTGVYDIWYSQGHMTTDEAKATLLIIKNDGTVYTCVGFMSDTINWIGGNWVRAEYELLGNVGDSGIIRWTDGSNDNWSFSISGDIFTHSFLGGSDDYTKINLP
ncbi:MAG: hypothetical protein LBT16_03740 [Treponema sp.]|jgi:hypothetical protein|nr:hypothetical protein [Treponema sp.]